MPCDLSSYPGYGLKLREKITDGCRYKKLKFAMIKAVWNFKEVNWYEHKQNEIHVCSVMDPTIICTDPDLDPKENIDF
jgi:hypothetical protein